MFLFYFYYGFIIGERYLSNKKIEKTIDNLYVELSNLNNTYMKEIKIIDNESKNIDSKIKNLINSIEEGISVSLIKE